MADNRESLPNTTLEIYKIAKDYSLEIWTHKTQDQWV